MVCQLISLLELRPTFFTYLSSLTCADNLLRDWLFVIIMFCGISGALPLFRLSGFMPWTGTPLSLIILLLLSPSSVQKFPTTPCPRVALYSNLVGLSKVCSYTGTMSGTVVSLLTLSFDVYCLGNRNMQTLWAVRGRNS